VGVFVFVFVLVAAPGLALDEGEGEEESEAFGEAGRRCPSGVVLVLAIIMLVRLEAAGIVVRSGTGGVALVLLTTLGAGLVHLLLLPCCAVTAALVVAAAAATATGAPRAGLEAIRAGLDGRLEGRAGLEGRVPKARPPPPVAIAVGRAGLLLLLLLVVVVREARGRTGLPMPAAEVLMAGVLPAFDVAAARGLEGVCVCAGVDFRRGDEGMVRCGVVACWCGWCGGSCAAAAGKSVDEDESTAPKSA
jgi:hypothetical protein